MYVEGGGVLCRSFLNNVWNKAAALILMKAFGVI